MRKIIKLCSYAFIFLLTGLFSYIFGGGDSKTHEKEHRVLKSVPSVFADVPYSQSSYYSEGGYGGKDGGGGGGGDGAGDDDSDADGGDDGADSDSDGGG